MNAVVFPGQGTQRTGMGAQFHHLSAAARAVYERANDVLGRDIATLCFRGTPDALRDTRNAQVAVVVTDIAAFELLKESGFLADFVAGHSVGELAAIYAAGCLELDDVLRMVQYRAELMGAIETSGTMAAIVGLPAQRTEALCGDLGGERVVAAVYNSDANTVVSGTTDAVAAVSERAKAEGGRVTPLQVSHAFHSPLMAPARAPWREFVATLPIRDPETPIAVNVTGALASDGAAVREAIVDQVTRPVQWRRTMATLRNAGVELAVEAGHSRALMGFARDTVGAARTVSLGEQRTLGEFVRSGGRSR